MEHDSQVVLGVTSAFALLLAVYNSKNYVKKQYSAAFSSMHGYVYDDDIDYLTSMYDVMFRQGKSKDEISKLTNSLSGYGWKCTPLHLAIARRSERCFQYLLKHREHIGLNLHDLDSRGLTPLHTACEYVTSTHHPNGKIEPGMMLPFAYVEQLVQAGANVNYAHATSGVTPLMIAISSYEIDGNDVVKREDAEYLFDSMIELFAKHNLRYNIKNKENGRTLMHEAALKGLTLLSQNLIKRGENCDVLTKFNESPLHFAVLSRKIVVIQLLLRQEPGLIRVQETVNGYSPLHLTLSKYCAYNKERNEKASSESAFIVEELTKRDGIAHLRDNERKTPLLLFASLVLQNPDSYNGTSEQIFKQLLRMRGPDIDAKDASGKTTLHYCCSSDRLFDVALALISLGADCSISDAKGNHPIHYLAGLSNISSGKVDTAYRLCESLLRSNRYSLNVKNLNGDTPIHLCAKSGSLTIFKEMVKNRWDPNLEIKDHNGDTCLHLAVARDSSNYYITNGNFTKTVINSITNIHALKRILMTPNTSNRDIPMHIAAKNMSEGGRKVIEILKEFFLNEQLSTRNSAGDTPAGISWRYRNLDSLLYLVRELGSELPFYLSTYESTNDSLLDDILSANGYWTPSVRDQLIEVILDYHMRRPQSRYIVRPSTLQKWKNASNSNISITISNSIQSPNQSSWWSTRPSAPPAPKQQHHQQQHHHQHQNQKNHATGKKPVTSAPLSSNSKLSPNANVDNIQYAEPIPESELTEEEARSLPYAKKVKKSKL